jgi:hypothetical protein
MSLRESQDDPFMGKWHRKPRLRDQASAIVVFVAGSVAIPLTLAVAIPAEICQQVWWKVSRRRTA